MNVDLMSRAFSLMPHNHANSSNDSIPIMDYFPLFVITSGAVTSYKYPVCVKCTFKMFAFVCQKLYIS